MSPEEFDLRAHLDSEAEHVNARGSFVEAVLDAKRRSDRRRAVAAGVAAVAVLAVAVPLAWSGLGGRTSAVPATRAPSLSATQTGVPTSTTPAPTAVPTRTASAADARVTARPTLAASAPTTDPGVPYAVAGLVRDGARPPLKAPDEAGFAAFSRLDHGGYVYRPTSGADQEVTIVLPDGTSSVLSGADRFVVSADRTRIAWRDDSAVLTPGTGVIHVADSRGRELRTVRVDAGPAALVGDTLYAAELAGYDDTGSSVRIELDTGRRTSIRGIVRGLDAAGRTALVVDPVPDETDGARPAGHCYRLLDLTVDPPVVRLAVCGDVTPTGISPDGRHLLAAPGSVVDATTGRVVLDAVGDSGLQVESSRITDDGTALVMSVDSPDFARNGLVRCELTGACRQIGPSAPEPAPEDGDTPRTTHAVADN
ncbi:hypothetical protein GCM10023258_18890 [Terrabacter aeriphilus]|uniref:Uncharacterized protein n=1 Tax=Terrabacter aeriphilus TaxID=515662 RepID=A0ABP9JCB4_9MICO